ncbi:hypothetical protein AA0483_1259 [Acetobacter syzygii NRIC 0483]|nr:hypothetical protein AA0483_1259 [Acetobacter syzygii NRIC 0483]
MLFLTGRQDRASPQSFSGLTRGFQACSRPLPDNLPLKLGKACKDGQKELTIGRARLNPNIQYSHTNTVLCKAPDQPHDIDGITSKPIQTCHYHTIPLPQPVQ